MYDPESPRGPDEPLTPLEHRLRGWRPSPEGLDRDRMLFEAGRASARAGARVGPWRFASAGLAAAVAGLGLALLDARSDQREMRHELAALRGAASDRDETARPMPPDELTAPALLVATSPAPIDPDPYSYLMMTRRLAIDGDLADLRQPAPDPGNRPTADGRPLRAFGLNRPIDL